MRPSFSGAYPMRGQRAYGSRPLPSWGAAYARRQQRAAARAERNRVTAVRLIYLLFALSLVEGALRKWVAPGFANPLFFLRDPVALVLYAHCLSTGFLGMRLPLARLWYSFAAFATLWGGIGYLAQGLDPVAWALGARNYWLYMPLMFVVAVTFRVPDTLRLMRWSLVLSVPYAALVILQYRAPASAWINRSVDPSADAVTIAFDIVRPYGLFTFTSQNVAFVAVLVAFLVAWVLLRRRTPIDTLILLAAIPAVGALAVLTGSRAIYFLVAAILAATVGGTLLVGRFLKTANRFTLLGVALAVAALLLAYQFGDMLGAMIARQEAAVRSEGSAFLRALATLVSFVPPLFDANMVGYGIGRGTAAVGAYLGHISYDHGGEQELGRNIYELGPLVGLVFVGLKLALAVHVARASLFVADRAGSIFLLPIAGCACVAIVQGQITASALNGFLPYLLAGMVLSTARILAKAR